MTDKSTYTNSDIPQPQTLPQRPLQQTQVAPRSHQGHDFFLALEKASTAKFVKFSHLGDSLAQRYD